MAKKSSNKLLIVAGIGVVAYILYKRSSSLVPVAVPVNTSTIPSQTVNAVNAAAATSGQYGSQTPTNPYATTAQQNLIFNWANSAWGTTQPGDLAQLLQMYPKFTASDIAGLVDLISTGFSPSAAHTQFWNTWRAQYDINNGTYA